MEERELSEEDFASCPECGSEAVAWHCAQPDCLWRTCRDRRCRLSIFDPMSGAKCDVIRKTT